MSGNQLQIADPPSDAISALRFSPHSDSNKFAVASWDKHVYLYEVLNGKECKQLSKFEHQGPVLDVCFGKDDSELFSACLDWDVRR